MDVKIKIAPLDKLIKALKTKPPVIRVGILGGGVRSGDNLTNAMVGAVHEFGTSTVPQRSFLRVPLSEELNPALKRAGMDKKALLKEVIATGKITPWCQRLAIVAEGVVIEAFDTGGYGKWVPSDMTHKKNHQTLVETQQLRDSITSEVKE